MTTNPNKQDRIEDKSGTNQKPFAPGSFDGGEQKAAPSNDDGQPDFKSKASSFVSSAAKKMPGFVGKAFAAAATPVVAVAGLAGFLGVKGLGLIRSKAFRTHLLLSPAYLAVGQCSFVERLPIDSSEAWSYAGSKALNNYVGAGSFVVDSVNSTIDFVNDKTDEAQIIAGQHGIGEPPATTATLVIPANYIAVECRPVISQDDRHQHATQIDNLRRHHDSLINAWKQQSGGFVQDQAQKGDVMVIYPHFNDAVQTPTLKAAPGGSYTPCPTGYNRMTYPLQKWVQNTHDAPTRY